jgi:hypothetical protein
MEQINDVFYASDLADCYLLNTILKRVFPTAVYSSEISEDCQYRIFLSCKMDKEEYFKILKDHLLDKVSLEAKIRGKQNG